ncbi:MAG: DsbA family protein [Nitrosarchaeum sp.]|nr:DsbA family protein [Nitrosarchaeum sp.]
MDSDEIKKSETDKGKISMNKSAFNALMISVIAASLVAAFFAGSYVNLKSDQVTKSELNSAIVKLESKISENQQPQQANVKPTDISTDNDPIRGDQNAPITIVEFSDFQCPFCARFQTQTLPLILEQYVDTGKVKFVFRDFPIQNSHPNAMPAAVAAECANEQNKYWQFHDELFENQGVWNKMAITNATKVFKEFATKLDLNQDQFNSCLDSGKYIGEINSDLNDGRKYGITGTPGFFIGNEKIGFVKVNGAQPFEVFKSVIDSQLNT